MGFKFCFQCGQQCEQNADTNESDNSNDDNGMFNRIMIIAIKNKYSFHITVASRNIAELVDSRRYAN